MTESVSSKFRHAQDDFDQYQIHASFLIIIRFVFSKGANNSGRLISCSFCEEKFTPSSVGDHLMMCGNKTDQCPICRKFIRRAIFAYHYENNCADLDAIDNDVSAAATQLDAPAAFQGNVPSHSSSRAAVGPDKQVTSMKVDLATHSKTQNDISHGSNSGRL
jgi:hypothetical protein